MVITCPLTAQQLQGAVVMMNRAYIARPLPPPYCFQQHHHASACHSHSRSMCYVHVHNMLYSANSVIDVCLIISHCHGAVNAVFGAARVAP